MKNIALKSIVFFLTLLITINVANAYKLIPFSAELSPMGKLSRQVFRLENNGNKPIAIELRTFARAMDIHGVDILEPADKDFIIYPAQTIIMPGKSQAVRVDWIGEKNISKELAFRLITEQLPINFDAENSEGAQISLLVRFIASVYIKPRYVKSNVILKSATFEIIENNKRALKLVFENLGNAHSLLRKPILTLSSGGKTITLSSKELNTIRKQNILENHVRQFFIPWPKMLPEGEIKAEFKYLAR